MAEIILFHKVLNCAIVIFLCLMNCASTDLHFQLELKIKSQYSLQACYKSVSHTVTIGITARIFLRESKSKI